MPTPTTLDYFMKRTEQDIKDIRLDMREEFDRLNQKIDKLSSFRFMLMGGAMALSGVTTIAIDLAFIYFGIHK